MALTIRDVLAADLDDILALNQISRPGVGSLTMAGLTQLVDWCAHRRVAIHSDQLVGMMLALEPGAPYPSENYRYFEASMADHIYVDRIAVVPSHQGQGIGRALYEDLFESHAGRRVTCEVNVKPMNAGSLRFHAKMGFESVGEQETEGGSKRVSLLVRSG